MNSPEQTVSAQMPDAFEIGLNIAAGDWPDEAKLASLSERAIAAAFSVASLSVCEGSEVSLLFTDDAAIRDLNGAWRQKDTPTNVLSFPGSDPENDTYGPLLGDIVFGFETVKREAEELGIEFSAHLTHLTVHGLLHLFDYDHIDADEAELMESKERAILAVLNIDDPYEGRPLAADGTKVAQ